MIPVPVPVLMTVMMNYMVILDKKRPYNNKFKIFYKGM
jgi:hypothetical protein